MKDFMKTVSAGNFWLGLGTAVALSVFGPVITKTAKPMAMKGAQGALYLSDKTYQMMKTGKEQLTSMVDDGMHTMKEKMPNTTDIHELVRELKEQNINSSQQISQLHNEIGELKNRLEQMTPHE